MKKLVLTLAMVPVLLMGISSAKAERFVIAKNITIEGDKVTGVDVIASKKVADRSEVDAILKKFHKTGTMYAGGGMPQDDGSGGYAQPQSMTMQQQPIYYMPPQQPQPQPQGGMQGMLGMPMKMISGVLGGLFGGGSGGGGGMF